MLWVAEVMLSLPVGSGEVFAHIFQGCFNSIEAIGIYEI